MSNIQKPYADELRKKTVVHGAFNCDLQLYDIELAVAELLAEIGPDMPQANGFSYNIQALHNIGVKQYE